MFKLAKLRATPPIEAAQSSDPRACNTLNCIRGGESARRRAALPPPPPPTLVKDSGRLGTARAAIRHAFGGGASANGLIAMDPNCWRNVHGLAITAPCRLYSWKSDRGVASPGLLSPAMRPPRCNAAATNSAQYLWTWVLRCTRDQGHLTHRACCVLCIASNKWRSTSCCRPRCAGRS